MEIYNKDFKSEMRGYDKNEVNEFLDLIIQNYEDLLEENERLKEQMRKMKRGGAGGNQAADIAAYEEALEEIFVRLERIEKIVL
jgi:DivIVA domain-containing protein